jgi:hypothetical protein
MLFSTSLENFSLFVVSQTTIITILRNDHQKKALSRFQLVSAIFYHFIELGTCKARMGKSSNNKYRDDKKCENFASAPFFLLFVGTETVSNEQEKEKRCHLHHLM